ncbi:MAG: DUF2218 domain-containing protein [Hyphomonadaceae bacterium]|nr:DUF2218 domain-containing protein [Hyphomonadaceae bacterium]
MQIEADIATPNASKYLQQLCKHWAHKMEVTFNAEQGLVPFAPDARCLLHAEADKLNLKLEAPDRETAARLGRVVVDHLRRFAFREELSEPVWRPA